MGDPGNASTFRGLIPKRSRGRIGDMGFITNTSNKSNPSESTELRLAGQPVMAGATVAEVGQMLDASERAADQVRGLVARNDQSAFDAVLNVLEAVQLTAWLVEEGVDLLVGDLVAIMESEL